MKFKVYNALLILTSFFGYLEWGPNQKRFLGSLEWEIITKLFQDPMSVLHPLTILPFLGQIVLVYTLFQKKQSVYLTSIGMSGIGILILLLFFIGCIGMHWKILLSTIPFFICCFFTIQHLRTNKKVQL